MEQEFVTHNFSNMPVFMVSGEPRANAGSSDWHFHEEMEFLWVRAKEKRIWVDNSEYTLQENDVVFFAPYVPHKTRTPKGGQSFLLQCNPFAESNGVSLPFLPPSQRKNFFIFRVGTLENKNVLSIFQRLREEHLSKANAHRAFIRALIMELFAYLYRYEILPDPEIPNVSKEKQAVLPVLEYIQNHFTEPVSLAQISEILHVDKSYFCRLFKRAIGVSFLEYVYFLRLKRAEELLLQTEKTVTEIAYETGFPSSAYFTKVFKQRKGYTPTFYKKLQKR